MLKKYPFRQLFLIMAVATLLVSALSILSLYNTAIEQHRYRLVELASSQARLIEAIAEYDGRLNGAVDVDSTVAQVAAAHSEFRGLGESGEFAMAQRIDDQIVFLLNRRPPANVKPHPIPYAGKWAEPMRRALEGRSGVFVGLDYRGVEVLAAHEPVAILDVGLVAKIDVQEIRAPFIRAGLLALGAAVLVIFAASQMFVRVSRPIIEAIDQQAETFQTLAETAREGIILADSRGEIQYTNRAAEQLFGYRRGELEGSNLKILMGSEHSDAHDSYMRRYLQTGVARIIGSGRQLTAKRKDGSRFPIYLSIGDINLSHTRLFAGVIMDMSEQQQLQREILEIPVNEQRRLGQELHDGLGQQLTGLGLLATSLLNKASKPDHALARQLAQGMQEAIAQVRALSRGLMPVDIDAEGFLSALQNLIDNVALQSDRKLVLTINDKVKISDNFAAMHLFRLAQEAINNAVKHAQASRIDIIVGLEGGRGSITVRDDGVGFAPANRDNDGLGLRIMEQRCGMIDAELHIESAPGRGTEVHCSFPIDTDEPT